MHSYLSRACLGDRNFFWMTVVSVNTSTIPPSTYYLPLTQCLPTKTLAAVNKASSIVASAGTLDLMALLTFHRSLGPST